VRRGAAGGATRPKEAQPGSYTRGRTTAEFPEAGEDLDIRAVHAAAQIDIGAAKAALPVLVEGIDIDVVNPAVLVEVGEEIEARALAAGLIAPRAAAVVSTTRTSNMELLLW